MLLGFAFSVFVSRIDGFPFGTFRFPSFSVCASLSFFPLPLPLSFLALSSRLFHISPCTSLSSTSSLHLLHVTFLFAFGSSYSSSFLALSFPPFYSTLSPPSPGIWLNACSRALSVDRGFVRKARPLALSTHGERSCRARGIVCSASHLR